MKYINKCNLCGGNNFVFVLRSRDRRIRTEDNQEFILYRCSDCGLVFQNPQLEWKELEYYDNKEGESIYGSEHNNPVLRRFDNLKKKLKTPIFWDCGKSSGRFLNVGCNTGAYEKAIIHHYPSWEFYGIEPNTAAFKEANKIPGFKVKKDFLDQADFPNDFFDIVLMNHVLEHTVDPYKTLRDCYRILKPEGCLIVAVPNFNYFGRAIFGEYWRGLDIPRHLFNFTSPVLGRMLTSAGFEVKKIQYEFAGSIINNFGMKYPNLKNFVKSNRFLWPFLGVISIAFSFFWFPFREIMILTHSTSAFRCFGVKPVKD